VNVEGRWQTWQGAAKLVGQSRPGWKVLRVLANLLDLPDFEYASASEVLAALQANLSTEVRPAAAIGQGAPAVGQRAAPMGQGAAAGPWIDVPPYQGDALVRGSQALGKTRDGQLARVVL